MEIKKMNIEKAQKIIQKNTNVLKKVEGNYEQISSVLEFGDSVFEELNDVFGRCTDYLNKPDDGGKNAPIPAWQGATPDKQNAKTAFDLLTKIMKESSVLMTEMTEYQHTYNLFIEKFSAFIEYQDKELKKRNFGAVYKLSDYIFIIEVMKQVPDLNKEIIGLCNTSTKYKIELNRLKNQLNILKGVN